MLKINEIFYSIQGESSLVGWPTLFIRTSGCHLRCQYCDTKYAYYKGEAYTVDSLITIAKQYKTPHVCLTGGEPLLQDSSLELMKRLCDENFIVSLETSGDKSCKAVDTRVLKIIDIKTPDSLEHKSFNEENLHLPIRNLEYKFVICSQKDFLWAEHMINQPYFPTQAPVYFSPSFNQFHPSELAQLILQSQSRARMQLQIHKFIWPDKEAGV